MEVGLEFDNLKLYNQKMARGLEDKLFFVNYLPKNQNYMFIDFGCANGVMINALYELYENKGNNMYYIGYDISDSMLSLARENFNYPTAKNVCFTSDWKIIEEKIKHPSSYKTVLILSSVIHEVYSYAQNDDLDIFWKRIKCNDFDYICVRDMMPSSDIARSTSEFKLQYFLSTISTKQVQMLEEFQHNYGPITNNKNFIHFLLKYRYEINWNREVHEDYFPIYIEDFIDRIINGEHKYNLTYLNRFRVPFMDDCIKKDFLITLDDYTHAKLIFEKSKK